MNKKEQARTVAQAKARILRKRAIIKEGLDGEFWQVLSEGIINEIELGRTALESPTQTKELESMAEKIKAMISGGRDVNVSGVNIKNDNDWTQFFRGAIASMRIVLEMPEKFIIQGDTIKKLDKGYKGK